MKYFQTHISVPYYIFQGYEHPITLPANLGYQLGTYECHAVVVAKTQKYAIKFLNTTLYLFKKACTPISPDFSLEEGVWWTPNNKTISGIYQGPWKKKTWGMNV